MNWFKKTFEKIRKYSPKDEGDGNMKLIMATMIGAFVIPSALAIYFFKKRKKEEK